MKELSEGEALNKAAAYCTLCERCIHEVVTKLTAWGVAYEPQQRIVKRLIEEKFIDEQRYCRAFVNDKIRFNHWGRIKIAASLREKHLPQPLIREALDSIDEEAYYTTLTNVIATKRKEIKETDKYKANSKLLRFAASRGFEPSLIMQALKFNPDEVDF